MKFHRLDDWLAWLETLHPQAIELGLGRVRQVAERLGVLSPGVPVVTVAGTNGKGSVTALLEALLQAHGLRAGVYTSPHILRFNERIRVDGRAADDASIMAALARVEAARGDVSLTYFEYTTLAALLLFRDSALDAWVLEIGLGGRLDAVNILDADVAVLTSVGLDHQDWLGDTREAIGREKAGVFRAHRPAVVGDTDPPASVLQAIAALPARGVLAGRDFAAVVGADDDGTWEWQGVDAAGQASRLPSLPRPALALANAATAVQAFMLLPVAVDPARLADALRRVRLAGRNQCLHRQGRAVVLDVGHNAHALAFLRGELARHGLGNRFHIVLGMLGDKDVEAAVRVLEPLGQSWHIAPLPSPRTATVARLAEALAAAGAADVEAHADVAAAMAGALARPDGLPVLAVGSFYTVAGALVALGVESLDDPG